MRNIKLIIVLFLDLLFKNKIYNGRNSFICNQIDQLFFDIF